ncbi:MAG TPA: DUF4352 domain-containing protein [Cerasibacillus sp.]|uniref:DUF4352 domain-containing protein n=1 Tax=Cerasibacillus sp. TaxID=2498711 RepID=UPI002F3F34EC
MKRILIILLTAILLILTACGDGDGAENTSENSDEANDTTLEKTKGDDQEATDGEIPVYQIGETAVITSDLYEFDYEVTVTDFNLTKEVDDVKIEDYIISGHGDERFAVVDVTIRNISDESYVPNEMFSANLASEGDRGGITSDDDFFEVGDKELAPGEELEGHLVYVILLDDSETFTLKYEFMSAEETHFILPNPEK